jgi:hypothetical protein
MADGVAFKVGAALLAASMLAGCHPKETRGVGVFGIGAAPTGVADRLTCPEHVGRLERTSATADGLACRYRGSKGEDVQLSRIDLNGSPAHVRLAALEETLKGEVPAAVKDAPPPTGKGDDDHTRIDLPGLHVNADGDRASIRLPGVAIDANGDKAQVSTGFAGRGAVVNAHAGGAEIRAGAADTRAVDVSYILAGDQPGPSGLRAAGYVAEGPAAGPIILGVFRAPDARGQDNIADLGVKRLVNLNVRR